jgi:hypothetical protein
MKVLFCSLLVLLCGAPVLAQDVFPPEGARLLADGPGGVLLQWPGSARDSYFVQIYAGAVAAVEQEVTGNKVSVPLRAGIGYQWKVNRVVAGGYQEVVPARSFQVMADTQVVIQGAGGRPGGQGTRRSGYNGLDGTHGVGGYHLTAVLEPVGEYVSLSITGAPANRQYFFAPGTSPIILASLGGQGGAGGPGYNGAAAVYNYTTGYVQLAEPGGTGGNGGDGGPGGNITVISNGLPVDRYLSFDTRGGAGGAGGPGGRGGHGIVLPPDYRGSQYSYGYTIPRGPDGAPGEPGRPGVEGRVQIR